MEGDYDPQARERVKKQFPHLYYRNGMFNQDAYRAMKPEMYRWETSPGLLWKTVRPPGAIFGPPPHSTDPESPSSQLFEKIRVQRNAARDALEDTKFDVVNEHRRVKDERSLNDPLDDIHIKMHSRDRSPTRK